MIGMTVGKICWQNPDNHKCCWKEVVGVQQDWDITDSIGFYFIPSVQFVFQNAMKVLIKRKWFSEHTAWLKVLAMFGGRGEAKASV